MSEPTSGCSETAWLTPPAYQREVVALLKETESAAWRWASSPEARAGHADELRTHLLKSTYRLDADTHAELHERTRAVAQRLGATAPVTIYQASGATQMNASLVHLPGEVHVIFGGPLLSTLKGAEVDAVVGHELAHHRLWELDGGDYLTADRLLFAAANDSRGAATHANTARRFRLYAEILADRGALVGCGDLHTAVAALVKTETGLADVSAAGYLRQADEIFARGNAVSQGLDHPESFIRARALRLWAEKDPSLDAWLAAAIEGELAIDQLDLAGQRRLGQLTRRLLAQMLRPSWFRTERALAHARAYFPDFAPADTVDEALAAELKTGDGATHEYLCFLLLDFAAVDPDLEDVPLAAAFDWSDRLGIAVPFEKLAVKELGLGKRQVTKVRKEASAMLARAGGAS